MAAVTKLPSAFTIPAGLSVSPLPLLLPTAGVSGYSSRYVPNTLAGADGSTVASISSTVDTSARTLQAPTTGQQPLLKVVGTDKYARFDGIDDVLTQNGTSAAWATLAFLARVATTSGVSVYNGSSNVFGSKGSTGFLNANAGSGGGGVQVGAGGWTANTWVVGIVVQNGASSTVTVAPAVVSSGTASATPNTVTGTLGTGTGTKLELGRNPSSVYGAFDLAEFLTWDTAITGGTNLSAIVNALIAAHSALIVNGG